MKLVALWFLVGAVWQIGMWLYGRHKFGAYSMDSAVRIAGGRWWMLTLLSASFLWPISTASYFFVRANARSVEAHRKHMANRCPDCGELIDEHNHEPPS